MKKRFLLFISLLTLSSCSLSLEDFFPSIEFPFLSSSSTTSFTASKEFGDNYYQPDKLKYTLQDINSQVNWVTSESVGNQKMLIVPVQLSSGTSWTTTMLNTIDDVFFGESSDTTFESVQSYFLKSSYNTLNIGGAVTDVFKSKYTKSDIVNATKNKITCSDLIAEEFYNSSNASLLKEYDVNKDGFVDNCVFIYSNNYASGSSSKAEQNSFWAWCTYYDYQSNSTKPSINNYMWASYNFINDGYSFYNNNKPDAHTFIHETGHMLGLDDYYDYDSNSTISPAGCLDMMDYNIGDHNAYSKYLLGWIEPTYVTKDVTLTIDSFESSGDSIIVPASLLNDKSPLDEYLIIEYYTPTGLNESDSKNKYLGSYPLLFTKNGVKIYHVDSRIGELEYTYDVSYGDYVYNYSYDDLVSKTDYNTYFGIFASNTSSYSYKSSYKLLNLLSSNKGSINNYYYSNTSASNKDLYDVNDEITSFKFNNGSTLAFDITIDDISSEGATISFRRK